LSYQVFASSALARALPVDHATVAKSCVREIFRHSTKEGFQRLLSISEHIARQLETICVVQASDGLPPSVFVTAQKRFT
jgi:hypothetical protein